ncbi:hypothetical protein FPHYL_9942 [Fusarium phyllophilum]|uniref:Uncharacterized protein n=1 Tax=Fusarium phyllophilum TaxID=47803 RepID=A0A8H5J4L0_9HYPO|nr:hypothetical protein FPHYL_9942 [Fusarium phyllophilum]
MDTKQDLPTFDHSAADFKEVGPRRAHMEQYFRALGLWNADLVEGIRAQRLEERCIKLREKKNKTLSHLYFEYAVDYGVWYSLLDVGNLSQEDHPWPHPVSDKPERKDFSAGVSRYYQDWLLRNGPLPKSQGESLKAPKSEPRASGASDLLHLSKVAFVSKAAVEAGKYWDEMHGRNATGSLSNVTLVSMRLANEDDFKSEASAKDMAIPGSQTQPAVAAETTQKSPAAAKDTVARYDPSIPFALQQAERAAAAKAARQS